MDYGKLDAQYPNGLWRMSGTEETFEYTVRGASNRGRVGVRHLPSGNVRIRLEPSPKIADGVIAKWRDGLPREVGYKQPGDGGQRRFSVVVASGDHADAILQIMFDLLGQGELKGFFLNPDMANPASTAEKFAA